MSSRHVSSLFQIYPQKKSLFQIKSQDVQCPWQKKTNEDEEAKPLSS